MEIALTVLYIIGFVTTIIALTYVAWKENEIWADAWMIALGSVLWFFTVPLILAQSFKRWRR